MAAAAAINNRDTAPAAPYHIALQAQDPPDRDTPKAPQGTGSRGDCLAAVNRPPLQRIISGRGIEKTSLGHPMFWVYVPYTADDAPSAEFSLQDQENDLYRVTLQLPSKPGFVSIQLPPSVKPIAEGETYRWYLDINCADRQAADNATPTSITGVIQRIATPPGLTSALSRAITPSQRATAYAKQDLFLEALTELSGVTPKNQTVTGKIVPLALAQEAIIGPLTASSQSE
ncbi:DUF928 domain-containing protein [filamentous cyanobacterium LEGE 11480]|uniref:DUF928 domain-containing protein n=1 Tax=Romeriopsis navalis LEGE 11480 TaxID=2777977 RepID=A0A928VJZ3_9CYAN|nr:DUF928 domain-containing protein [Romeriopsis navalis]MBE9029037.1 DUF928 domain-containing protein [Romeriopsis navalis LEGE 11480]